MKIVEIYPRGYSTINVRHLFGLLFFSPHVAHPDSKRQRSTRQRDLDVARARQLKQRRATWTPFAPYVEPQRWGS